MDEQLPTRGQLERNLSQGIQALYREHLGHQPAKVTCQLFSDKLAVILEDSITTTEQVLLQEGKQKLAKEVRSGLDDATRPELKKLIEEILEVKVIDLLSDATFETGRTAIIAVLENSPPVRNPQAIPKVKNQAASNNHSE